MRPRSRYATSSFRISSHDANDLPQKLNDQNKKIEALTADVGHLRKRNTDLQVKLEQAAELTNTNNALSKAKDDLSKQMDNLAKELNEAKDDAKNMQGKVHMLKAKLAVKDAVLAVGNDKALFEKVKGLEEKRESLEAALAEWTELAKVCLPFLLLLFLLLYMDTDDP